jgi:hypothetical protein
MARDDTRVPVQIGYATNLTPLEENLIGWGQLHFTLEDLDDPEFLWCDSPGERPGTVWLGISLVPLGDHDDELTRGAIYLDITLDEIRKLQVQLQRVIDDNTEET